MYWGLGIGPNPQETILDKSINFKELQWKKALFIFVNKGASKLVKYIDSKEMHP